MIATHFDLANVLERLAGVKHAVVQMADSSTPVFAVSIVVCLVPLLLLDLVVDLVFPLHKEGAEGDSTGHNDSFIWRDMAISFGPLNAGVYRTYQR